MLNSLAPRLLAARQESTKAFSASFSMTSHLGKDIAMTAVSPPAGRLSRRAKAALALGTLVVVAIAAAVSIVAVVSHRPSQKHTVSYSSQVVLPFTHLDEPWGVAVDRAGNLFTADHITHQLMKLAAGASAPTPLPSAGLTHPTGMAVDDAGNVYVTDNG